MSRCGHCPIAAGQSCRGEELSRLCELVDPGHPDFNPSYRAVLSSDAAVEPAPVDPEESRLDAEMRRCPSRRPAPCACPWLGICSRLGREVVRIECHTCLKGGRDG